MQYSVVRYSNENCLQWNEVVNSSKNGTFLLNRGFMEYHSDRFEDFSLMVFEGDKPVAILPAHIKENVVYSHWGLTYGGLVYSDKLKLASVIKILGAILSFLYENGVHKLHVKLIPAIYHKVPADEFSYALFTADAKLTRKDSLCIIDNDNRLPFTKTRKESIRRGLKNGLVIKEEPEFQLFWDAILIPNLHHKHDVKPVHTAKEIALLHQKFPDNIRHFNVYLNDAIVAGTTVFITDTVAHPQYISGNRDKNELGSLDYLYAHLINDVFADKRFFDFGISNEEQGRKLNEGLVFWKESFGARTQVQDFYEVETANFTKLDNVLI
ncbi:GNAT family N-acetyltransferase [Flavobacterium sp. DG1-102-2]|uniref:GNAT family N-acetyltransferase n=1 Tax=Flavobacterium sp. DG1-102-2 TaxID=3081663 RepID=UPI00294A99BE|nr:GNAT family N-acetyltransferase [Flavobacterium sp. DG1-102-2]MDV6168114.1 GNAT family N-acetyltransferase [Flavobacterium sp. DG1-102-2]